jgi:hypothetical protein
MQFSLALITASSFVFAQGPPSAQSISGRTTSAACTMSSGTCSGTGSSNYISRSLSYSTTTGLFTGTIITNQCSNDKWGRYSGVDYSGSASHSASCVQQTFPAPAYVNTPVAAPLRNVVGYSITGGVNIYGPFEAGFTAGQACTTNAGTCEAGIDVYACSIKLAQECGSSLKSQMMIDDCGGLYPLG